MKARRIVSVLLTLMMILSIGTVSATSTETPQVTIEAWDGTVGESGPNTTWVDPSLYTAGWTADGQLWITVQPGVPVDQVRVTVTLWDDARQAYTAFMFYDELNGTEWLNLGGSEMFPAHYRLLRDDFTPLEGDIALTMTTEAMPTGGSGDNGDNGGNQNIPENLPENNEPEHNGPEQDDEDEGEDGLGGGNGILSSGESNQPIEPVNPVQTMPPDRESDFAWVKNDATPYYNWPNSGVLGTFDQGILVVLTMSEAYGIQTIDNKVWCPVTRAGTAQFGYVMLDDIELLTALDVSNYIQTFGTHASRYATVDTGGAELRSAMGVSAGTVPAGRVVQFQEGAATDRFIDDQGKLWLLITSREGDSGFVPYSSITFMTQQDEEDYLGGLKEQMGTHESLYAWVKGDGASLTDVNGRNAGTVAGGIIVHFEENIGTDRYHDAEGKLWLHITSTQGHDAYIR